MRQQKTATLPLSKLQLDVYTPRKQVSPQYISELAESIGSEGQHKAIIIQFKTKGEKYPVIDGECRIKAMRLLKQGSIRAEVWNVSDEEAMFYAMRINQMHGKRLEPLEEALHIKKTMEKYSLTQQQICVKYKRSQTWVSKRLGLLKTLSSRVQEKIIRRRINLSKAEELLPLNMTQQEQILDFVVREQPSVKETRFIAQLAKKSPEKAERLARKDRLHLQAEMKHAVVVDTAERLEEVVTAAKELWTEDHVCIDCGKHFRIDWVNGRVEW